MSSPLNDLGQPIGVPLPGWRPAALPWREPLEGRFCRLETVRPSDHAAPLFAANAKDREGRMWTYLPYGPFPTLEAYRAWMEAACRGADPLFYVILERPKEAAQNGTAPAGAAEAKPKAGGLPLGLASYMRIAPEVGVIEVGQLAFSPALQQTPAATEALYLLIGHVFALGYRRCEWKCDALNDPSRRAARRLGFSYEGTFRQSAVVKGRNRDTAWFSILDTEWPVLEASFRRWLAPENFEADGTQRESLSRLTAPLLRGPRAE
ncbi:Protein N-acetyltransferase, RimJ/RimL family [Verrucomicrobium sp. GAS474]|uniref:GNAT family N-acetyltransferase n=1 Tax=Verrucomicrobium sp. GAS474 TaxID=1882831 RepID=UPI00087C30F9|nr:GNAT family protein [Verrucomicrobium sp. GAS474]SDT89376.1 Protein N-acetyltransferase, RimJ/RimL family [Verrucomicrobium sp. GAS474]